MTGITNKNDSDWCNTISQSEAAIEEHVMRRNLVESLAVIGYLWLLYSGSLEVVFVGEIKEKD